MHREDQLILNILSCNTAGVTVKPANCNIYTLHYKVSSSIMNITFTRILIVRINHDWSTVLDSYKSYAKKLEVPDFNLLCAYCIVR